MFCLTSVLVNTTIQFYTKKINAGIDLKADYEIVMAIPNGIILMEDNDKRARNYFIIQYVNRIESIYSKSGLICTKEYCLNKDLTVIKFTALINQM